LACRAVCRHKVVLGTGANLHSRDLQHHVATPPSDDRNGLRRLLRLGEVHAFDVNTNCRRHATCSAPITATATCGARRHQLVAAPRVPQRGDRAGIETGPNRRSRRSRGRCATPGPRTAGRLRSGPARARVENPCAPHRPGRARRPPGAVSGSGKRAGCKAQAPRPGPTQPGPSTDLCCIASWNES
jgi:hypothetical protein